MAAFPDVEDLVAEKSDAEMIVRPLREEPAADVAPMGRVSLFRTIWRWHFYAGLILAPLVMVVAATGALYAFKAELSNWLYHDLYFVEPQGDAFSYDQQLEIAQREAGDLELEGLFVSADPNRSTQFVAHVHEGGDENPEQMHKVFFVDPYQGAVLGTHILEKQFFSVILSIHRTLFAGLTGRFFTELTTSWVIVLLISGLYLWWPKTKKAKGVWYPRVRGRWYAVLRDWHAVSGFYAWPFAVLVVFTGLFFTPVWGTGYLATAQAVGASPMALFAPSPAPPPTPDAPKAALDQVVSRIREASRPGDTMLIQFAEKPDVSHNAFIMKDDDKMSLRIVHVDQYSGETISVKGIQYAPLMLKLYALSASIHMGLIFGVPTKILAVIVCLVLMVMAVSGLWMWWERRPRGQSGFPRKPDQNIPGWLKAVIVVLCFLMPLMGISVLLILLGEWLFQRTCRLRPAAA